MGDEKKPYKISGAAYTGIPMSVWYWSPPVVVDLAGFKSSGKLPLLADHKNSIRGRLGSAKHAIEGGKILTFQGQIVSESEDAKEIIGQSQKGEKWQVSIGAKPLESEEILEGTHEINGRKIKAPFIWVKKSRHNETSIVSVGADTNTRMVAASGDSKDYEDENLSQDDIVCVAPHLEIEGDQFFQDLKAKYQADKSPKTQNIKGKAPMGDEITDPKNKKPIEGSGGEPATAVALLEAQKEDLLKGERERIKAHNKEIRDICKNEYPKIETQAIDEMWELDRVREEILKAIRKDRPEPDFNVNMSSAPEGNELNSVLEAAFCMRANISGEALIKEHKFHENIVQKADENYVLSIGQLCTIAAKAEGKTSHQFFSKRNQEAVIRAAFSTVSLPGILGNVANKALQQAYRSIKSYADLLCRAGDLNDFKPHQRYRMTDMGDLEPLGPDGSIAHGSFSEEFATIKLKTFAKIFGLTFEMAINDDMGAFTRIPVYFGRKAVAKKDKLYFGLQLGNANFTDNVPLFHANHKNYAEGADTAISFAALDSMKQKFRDQVDSDGEPIMVEPRFWLVPTKWETRANEIAGSRTKMGAGGDGQADAKPQDVAIKNALADLNLTVLSPPHLSNSKYPGHSTEAHYLNAHPDEADTFEFGYLNGQREPQVQYADTDFSTLGMLYRVVYYLACAPLDFRAISKYKGEA